MWIFLGICGAILVLILVILLLPAYTVIRSDEQGRVVLCYKFLGKTFGEHPDPNSPIMQFLSKSIGLSHFHLKQQTKEQGVTAALKDAYALLISLIREAVALLRGGSIRRLELEIICADEDAAVAAVSYGTCCAMTYPLLSFLETHLHVRPAGKRIDITCDYARREPYLGCYIVIRVMVLRLLMAYLRLVRQEKRREKGEA